MISPFFYGGWKYYLPVRAECDILFIGRPEGIFSLNSEKAAVAAVSPDDVGAEFLSDMLRSQLGNQARIRVLPYRELDSISDASIDGAVIHGWMEWTARMKAVNPRYSGRACLETVSRALKDGGTLLVTASGISLLRAFEAAWKSRPLGLKLAEILIFKDTLYGPALYKIQSVPAAFTLQKAVRAAVHFFRGGGFGFIYKKGSGAARETLLEKIVCDHTRQEAPTDTAIYHGSGGVYTLLTPHWIYRMPQFDESETRCAVNYGTLQYLKTLTLPFRCPEPSGVYSHHGRNVYVESRIPGEGINYLSATEAERAGRANAVYRALAALQRQTLRVYSVADSGTKVRGALIRSLSKLKPCFDAEINRGLEEFMDTFVGCFEAKTLQWCHTHGDFKIANTLWDEAGSFSGIIDWDLSSRENFPLIDYLTYDAFDRSVAGDIDFCRALAASRYEDFAKSVYYRESNGLSADPALFAASIVITLLHYGEAHFNFLREDLKMQWYSEHLGIPLRESLAAYQSTAKRGGAAQHV